SGKRKLWSELIAFKLNNVKGEWVLGGDFNAILNSGERRGCNGGSMRNERIEFGLFVDSMELVDIPVAGKKFSWFSADGKTMSRLDRFLLSEGFIAKGGISGQWIGNRDISDHCPISLICSNTDWGPKPFKFNNCWIDHPEFKNFVSLFWGNLNVTDLNIENTVTELNVLEDVIASGGTVSNACNLKEINQMFWNQINRKESLLKQKSRVKWVQEGDSNSRFFHANIKGRRRRNQLGVLKKGQEWIQGVECIKKERIMLF
ncbi:cysteine-rich receptor-like protein kinase, partial [Trifolium pratense]